MSASPDPTSPSSTSKFEESGGSVKVTEECFLVELSSAVTCVSGEFPEDVLPSPSTAKGFVADAGAAGFAEVDDGALPRLGSAEGVGFVNFTLFFFVCDEGVTHSRPAGMVIDASARDVEVKRRRQCEVGATERGCSGSIGSDDTRGYGAGSGDVGKELPRGMIP